MLAQILFYQQRRQQRHGEREEQGAGARRLLRGSAARPTSPPSRSGFDASSRFRIELARAAEADEFSLARADGELEPLFIEVEGGTISAPRATLDAGRSGMILTEEGEHTVVLHSAGNEVRRATLFFPAGGLHELRP